MEPAEPKDYIYAHEQDRESVLIRRFFADQGPHLNHWFRPTLGLNLPLVWLGLGIPHERLLRGFNRPLKKFLGDVDVFGATLQVSSEEEFRRCLTRHAELSPPEAHPTQIEWLAILETVYEGRIKETVYEGRIKWPPDLSYIAAIEVKAAYYDAASDLKAAGGKRKGRDQARELCKMGFDRVALGRFVVTEPVVSENYHPWMLASARSAMARDNYLDETKGILFQEDDPFGTVLVSGGAIPGKLEHMAGTTGAEWLRKPPDNPFKKEAEAVRRAVEENLLEVISRHPFPARSPS
jgi:hypothetical protein